MYKEDRKRERDGEGEVEGGRKGRRIGIGRGSEDDEKGGEGDEA